LCLSIKAFYAVRIFAGLRGGIRIARRVGWVERSDTHHRAAALNDGFRKNSTHPTGYGLLHAFFAERDLDRAGAQFWIEAYQLIVGTRKLPGLSASEIREGGEACPGFHFTQSGLRLLIALIPRRAGAARGR
jgi:hypothetical protein